jgi:hypothetical protein
MPENVCIKGVCEESSKENIWSQGRGRNRKLKTGL